MVLRDQPLPHLHRPLDVAVFAAYGWEPGISDDELLERLLELNLQYAAEEDEGIITPPWTAGDSLRGQ